ncbi:MAG TPA: hypothetical protein VK858_04540 [Longimicrobiales bacterium]|nr:hypothetical protein [Longimicrobiales bacterium]
MDWIALGANLGVIGGLVLVAIQIRQSRAALHGSAYQTWVASNMELSASATQPDLSRTLSRGWMDSSALDQETFIQFAMWVFGVMQMAQATDRLYRRGMVDESLWTTEMQRAALFLTAPGIRQWWDAGGRTQLTPEFVTRIESIPSRLTTWGWDPQAGFVSFDTSGAPGDARDATIPPTP